MKNKKADDFWEKLITHKSNFMFSKISINNNDINLNKNLNFICGLNGAKKTFLLKKISNIVSCNKYKFSIPIDLTLSVNCLLNNNEILLNGDDSVNYYTDFVNSIDIIYVDAYSILSIQRYFEQENIDDFFCSNEVINLNNKELSELNHLCGKEYSKCECVSIDVGDVEEMDKDYYKFLPFYLCKVKEKTSDSEYYSTNMGSGEFCLVYFYFLFKGCKDNSIFIIDEPETFISIPSQIELVNLIVSFIIKHNASFIISTHSCFIIEKAKSDNIYCIYSQRGNILLSDSMIYSPKSYLGDRNFIFKKRLIIVEDYNAKIFLKCILNDYFKNELPLFEINISDGFGDICNALLYNDMNNEYFRIGLFDGDLKNSSSLGNLQHSNYMFLPCVKNIDDYFVNHIFKNDGELELFSSRLGVKKQKCDLLANKYNSCDVHDYFNNICNELKIDSNEVIKFVYERCKFNHLDEMQKFSDEFRKIIQI